MILMSPSNDLAQTTPVTTTYDVPDDARHRTDGDPRERMDHLYAFVVARAEERRHLAERLGDTRTAGLERLSTHVLRTLHTQAQQRDHVLVACAVNYFRARALRDADHPDFLGSWITGSSM